MGRFREDYVVQGHGNKGANVNCQTKGQYNHLSRQTQKTNIITCVGLVLAFEHTSCYWLVYDLFVVNSC